MTRHDTHCHNCGHSLPTEILATAIRLELFNELPQLHLAAIRLGLFNELPQLHRLAERDPRAALAVEWNRQAIALTGRALDSVFQEKRKLRSAVARAAYLYFKTVGPNMKGLPPGRPREGFIDPVLIEVCFPVGLLDAVAATYKDGRRLTGDLRDEFSRVLATDAEVVNPAALAKLLGCDKATITRARKHGLELVHRNHPSGEDKMPVADAELAVDAERLAEIAADVLNIAARLQARFPSSQILGATIDRFIEAALESEVSPPRAA